MQALRKLLKDNGDPSDTRYDILTGAEVSAIVEALNCQVVIDKMIVTYNRRHPEVLLCKTTSEK